MRNLGTQTHTHTNARMCVCTIFFIREYCQFFIVEKKKKNTNILDLTIQLVTQFPLPQNCCHDNWLNGALDHTGLGNCLKPVHITGDLGE